MPWKASSVMEEPPRLPLGVPILRWRTAFHDPLLRAYARRAFPHGFNFFLR
jgi:hypothetical protein